MFFSYKTAYIQKEMFWFRVIQFLEFFVSYEKGKNNIESLEQGRNQSRMLTCAIPVVL